MQSLSVPDITGYRQIKAEVFRRIRAGDYGPGDLLPGEVELAAQFAGLAKSLTENEDKIVAELAAVQGHAADIGGYYKLDLAKADAVMRPSGTFNAALATVGA